MALMDLRASHVGQTHKNKHVLPITRPPCMVHLFTSFLWPILLDFLTCGCICECNHVVGSYPCRFVVKFICLHFLLPYCVGFHATGPFLVGFGQCSVGHVYGCRNTFHVSVNENLNFGWVSVKLCKFI